VPTKRNRTTWKLDREIEGLLLSLIKQRKERRRRSADGKEEEIECHGDLLEALIQASLNSQGGEELEKNKSWRRITEQDIVEECKSFFFAGKHTTSNLLIWTTILLAMHPQWQQLAREEVLRVCGARDIPTRDHLSNLKTVYIYTLYFASL